MYHRHRSICMERECHYRVSRSIACVSVYTLNVMVDVFLADDVVA